MSWWHLGRHDALTARVAVPTDRAAVTALLGRAWRRYGSRSLDDQAALLQNGLSTIAFLAEEPVGFLGLAPRKPAGSPPEAWVDLNLLAVETDRPVERMLRLLLEPARRALSGRQCTGVLCLTAEEWLRDGLGRVGFARIDQVIGYVHASPKRLFTPLSVAQLRPATMRDVDTILALNAAAFAPLWCYDDAVVMSWLLTADRAILADYAGRPAGFALAVNGSNGNFAHLVRVATHPEVQDRGIGRQMVADAVCYAHGRADPGLALNTQASNTVSRHLYESLGFQPAGPTLAVMVYRL